MAAGAHALRRSLRAMTFGAVEQNQRKLNADSIDKLEEREEQLLIPVSGSAAVDPYDCLWAVVNVPFQTFFPGESQGMRDSDFNEPFHWFGYRVDTRTPVALYAHVYAWDQNTNLDFVGCTVRMTAIALGSSEKVEFTGAVMLTIQGWGAPDDQGDSDPDSVPDEEDEDNGV